MKPRRENRSLNTSNLREEINCFERTGLNVLCPNTDILSFIENKAIEGERRSTYWCMPAVLNFSHSLSLLLTFLFLLFYFLSFFACCSCICRDLEIGLYVLSCTFGFFWRGLFSDLPFFMTCFFLGVGPCRIMGLPSPGLFCIHSVALLAFPAIPLCYSCCNVV